MHIISVFLAFFLASTALGNVLVYIHEEHPTLRDTFLWDANRFRAMLDSTNMLRVKWDLTLEAKSHVIALKFLEQFRCQANWDCETANCDGYTRKQLAEKGLYHEKLRSYDGAGHAMGRMYQFLGAQSPPECGNNYELYWSDNPDCRAHAYKIFSKTNRVGCKTMSCRDGDPPAKSSIHFVCHFLALTDIPEGVPGQQEAFKLFHPASISQETCSECPEGFNDCANGLCSKD